MRPEITDMESVVRDSLADDDDALEGSRAGLRYGAVLIVAGLLAGGVYRFMNHDDLPPPIKVQPVINVTVLPPPPPPPPPAPPPQQQPEPKMIEQPKMAEPEVKVEKPQEKPKNEPPKEAKNMDPPGPLALDAKAVGPGDLFGLGGKKGGTPYGSGTCDSGNCGSRWGYYATIVQTQIEQAFRANPKTKNAVLEVRIRLWADGTGRVSRIQLVTPSGDAEVDAAIRDNVFAGLMLREPPPKDMPMPIVTRVTARRPT